MIKRFTKKKKDWLDHLILFWSVSWQDNKLTTTHATTITKQDWIKPYMTTLYKHSVGLPGFFKEGEGSKSYII